MELGQLLDQREVLAFSDMDLDRVSVGLVGVGAYVGNHRNLRIDHLASAQPTNQEAETVGKRLHVGRLHLYDL